MRRQASIARRLADVFPVLMACWLLASACLRVLPSLSSGLPIDVLPGITAGIGALTPLLLLSLALARVQSRKAEVEEQMPTGSSSDAPRSDF